MMVPMMVTECLYCIQDNAVPPSHCEAGLNQCLRFEKVGPGRLKGILLTCWETCRSVELNWAGWLMNLQVSCRFNLLDAIQ